MGFGSKLGRGSPERSRSVVLGNHVADSSDWVGRGLRKEAMELLSPRGIGLIGPSIPRCGYSHGAHSEPVELFNLGLFRANVPHLRPSTRSY